MTLSATIATYWNLFATQSMLPPGDALTISALSVVLMTLVFWVLIIASYTLTTVLGITPATLARYKKWEVAWCFAHIPFHGTLLALSNLWFARQWSNGFFAQAVGDYGYLARDEVLLRNVEAVFVVLLTAMFVADLIYRAVFKVADVGMVIHHIVGLSACIVALATGTTDVAIFSGMSETTGIFLDISQILDRIELSRVIPTQKLFLDLMLLLLFITHRFILFPYVLLRYMPKHPMVLASPTLYWYLVICFVIAISLNYYWFFRIIEAKLRRPSREQKKKE